MNILYESYYGRDPEYESLMHSGVKGQKHGVRRYQYKDGSLTPLGREHYGVGPPRGTKKAETGSRDTLKSKASTIAASIKSARAKRKEEQSRVYRELAEDDARKAKAKREKLINSADVKAIQKKMSSFSDEELERALKRFDIKKRLDDTVATESSKKQDQTSENKNKNKNKKLTSDEEKRKQKLLKEGNPKKLMKNLDLFSTAELDEVLSRSKVYSSLRELSPSLSQLNGHLSTLAKTANNINTIAKAIGEVQKLAPNKSQKKPQASSKTSGKDNGKGTLGDTTSTFMDSESKTKESTKPSESKQTFPRFRQNEKTGDIEYVDDEPGERSSNEKTESTDEKKKKKHPWSRK